MCSWDGRKISCEIWNARVDLFIYATGSRSVVGGIIGSISKCSGYIGMNGFLLDVGRFGGTPNVSSIRPDRSLESFV